MDSTDRPGVLIKEENMPESLSSCAHRAEAM